MKSSPLVYIIILNWNGWKDTVECVQSCKKLTCGNYRILIVDNGSTDNSEAILRDRFSDIEVLQSGANLGFAGGNNVGIRYALQKGAEYVWLLNNDTIVDEMALSELVKVADSDGKIGIVGSKIYYFNEPRKIWFAGGIVDKGAAQSKHRGERETDNGQYDKNCEVDFVTGCSLLVKRNLIDAIGPMREDYFLYWEDVDWSLTARERGWKVFFAPRSNVWHKVSASITDLSYAQSYYYFRGRLLFFRRHFPGLMVLSLLTGLKSGASCFLHGKKDVLRGYLSGLKDFVLQRFGRKVA